MLCYVVILFLPHYRDEESPWIYRNSLELKGAPYAGTLTTYKGGGYTFTFKRTRDHTDRLMRVSNSDFNFFTHCALHAKPYFLNPA